MKIKIPKNLILNGTDNNGFRHRYSFDKTKDFKKGFFKLMKDLEFDSKQIEKKFFTGEYKDTEEGEIEKIAILEAKDFEDVCWFFKNEKYEVDVFFGKEKVIILIRIKSKFIREMLDKVEKDSDWISGEEKEKRLKKNKNLLKSKLKIVK